jgi:hypothetical protein
MGSLVDRLIQYLEEHPVPPLTMHTILTPSSQIRQWLFLEIAKRKNITMGLKFVEIGEIFPQVASSLEVFCRVYSELAETTSLEIKTYIQDKPHRHLRLTSDLTSLFFSYGKNEKKFFEENPSGWQQEMLQKIFVQGPCKAPVQIDGAPKESIICFGIDFLPDIYWDFLFKAPSLAVFLFSPCAEFWEDICSDRERKNLNRFWKKKGASKAAREELDLYLRSSPKLLANLGKLGRKTLKVLDRFDLETEEIYPDLIPNSALKNIQHSLLTFQQIDKILPDDSVKVYLTGSSLWEEVECLRDQILNLDIPFHEISIMAPNIEPYVPFIEYVFSELIPYRISTVYTASQSLYRQALKKLIELTQGRWDVDQVFELFENPSFYRKKNWDEKALREFKEWTSLVNIQWGVDESHRNRVLAKAFEEKSYRDLGSWEKGIEQLLDTFIYPHPLQINADQLEEFLIAVFKLKNLPLQGEKTLPEWADCLEKLSNEYLFVDETDEKDNVAYQAFCNALRDFRRFKSDHKYPLSVVQHFLERPFYSHINTSLLHAVRIGSLENEAMIPAKAVFLLGMNEESFPRTKSNSSLDLTKGKYNDLSEKDRYLFLQAIFSAEEFLSISYCHLSAEEGKPIGPSLVVQELMESFSENISTGYRSLEKVHFPKKLIWPSSRKAQYPKTEMTISIAELRALARHPWKFYLQKAHGIFLKEPMTGSFAMDKGLLLRKIIEGSLDKRFEDSLFSYGPLGKTLYESTVEEANSQLKQLQEWNLDMVRLSLQESCQKSRRDGSCWTFPAIELDLNGVHVRVVGDIKFASNLGFVCLKDDLQSLLKAWPEALVTAIATGDARIWCPRTGKYKEIAEPLASLTAFVEYYFTCLQSPSPLLLDWADSLLRKDLADFEKAMNREFTFEDPVFQWVLDRIEPLSPAQIYEEWGTYLKNVFGSLAQLYPTRGKNYAEL